MTMVELNDGTARAAAIASRVEAFVRDIVAPYEHDPRCSPHGPSEDLVRELRVKAREAGVMTPHVLADGSTLAQRETARSEARRVGKECVSTCRSRWSPYHDEQQTNNDKTNTHN